MTHHNHMKAYLIFLATELQKEIQKELKNEARRKGIPNEIIEKTTLKTIKKISIYNRRDKDKANFVSLSYPSQLCIPNINLDIIDDINKISFSKKAIEDNELAINARSNSRLVRLIELYSRIQNSLFELDTIKSTQHLNILNELMDKEYPKYNAQNIAARIERIMGESVIW